MRSITTWTFKPSEPLSLAHRFASMIHFDHKKMEATLYRARCKTPGPCKAVFHTGSIGYIAQNGDFDFNVAIRTLVVHPTHVKIQLGGGIVIDSDPRRKYEETLHKGKSLFKIMGAYDLCLL